MSLWHWLSLLLLLGGSLFGAIGALGIVRLPDFFTRLHAAGITDTLCAALILGGLMLQAEHWHAVFKLALVLFFLLLTSPVSTHALARAAANTICPVPQEGEDDAD